MNEAEGCGESGEMGIFHLKIRRNQYPSSQNRREITRRIDAFEVQPDFRHNKRCYIRSAVRRSGGLRGSCHRAQVRGGESRRFDGRPGRIGRLARPGAGGGGAGKLGMCLIRGMARSHVGLFVFTQDHAKAHRRKLPTFGD